jgi:UDP-glucose 4-epimerase
LSRRGLGFGPRHSDLKTIVQTAWAWHQKAHPKLNDRPRGMHDAAAKLASQP